MTTVVLGVSEVDDKTTRAPLRKLRLRYSATCVVCHVDLPAKSQGWWNSETKEVRCLVCGSDCDFAREHAGVAGGSARQRFDRLHSRREEDVKGRFGKRLGGLVLTLSDDPQSTRAWETGSEGEERLGRFLERELPETAFALHDRRIPGSRANIDHIVVAPTGVWVIDAKLYKGRVERRTIGSLWRAEQAVFVGGRNRTKVIHGMERQVEAVRKALAADPLASDLEVHPVVCFVESEWKLFAKPFELGGVLVTWPRKLIERVARTGPLTGTAVTRLANRLAVELPAVTKS